MKKNKIKFLILLSITSVAIAATTLCASQSNNLFVLNADDGSEWVHYNEALPGTIPGQKNGVREYWVKCGSNYTFTKPLSSRIREGSSYDFSEFSLNDPRYIIPVVEGTNEFKSVLVDVTDNKRLYKNEVAELQDNFTCDSTTLPSTSGEKKNVIFYSSSNKDNNPYYYVQAIGYTKVFYDWANLRNYFGGTASAGSSITPFGPNVYLDGTYAVSQDFAITQNIQYTSVPYTTPSVTDRGFRGTFDGRGHTISENNSSYAGGLFGGLLGATVKNLTLKDIKLANEARGALACQMHNSTIENVNLYYSSISNMSETSGMGIVCTRFMENNNFKNINIYAIELTIPNVFGGNYVSSFYSNVNLYANKVNAWCGTNYAGNNLDKPDGVNFVSSHQEIIVEGDPQDIIVNTIENQSLYLGSEYSSVSSAQSITLTVAESEFSLGTNVKSLQIPDSLKSDSSKCGSGTVKIIENSVRSFVVSVTVITKVIDTISDIEAIAAKSTSTSPIYGYYILKEDKTFGSYSIETHGAWNYSGSFSGTLDGRGHSLTLDLVSAHYGLLGVIKNAKIKDINIISSKYYGYYPTLAYYVQNSVIQNVNLSIAKNAGEITSNCEHIFISGGSLNNTYSNFNFVADVNVSSFINNYYSSDTWSNCSIVVKTLGMFAHGAQESTSLKNPPAGVALLQTDISGGEVIIDKSQSTNTLDVTISGTIRGVYWNSKKISDSLVVPTSSFGDAIGEGHELVVKYVSNNIECSAVFKAILATKVLKTVADLKGFLDISDSDNGTSGDGIYTGYFILGNDIKWDGSEYKKVMKEIPRNAEQYGKGFIGTFNGLGHYISELIIRTDGDDYSGFITKLGAGGIIKNVAFTDFKSTNSSIISAYGEGHIENTYVSFASSISHWGTFGVTNIYGNLWCNNILENCLVDARNDCTSSAGRILGSCYSDSTLLYNDVYVLTKDENTYVSRFQGDAESGAQGNYDHISSLSVNTYSAYTNYADLLKDAGDDINTWDYFSFKNNSLCFGEKVIINQTPSAITTHNFIDDYVIVYDKDNLESIKGAFLVEKELYKATGKISYSNNADGSRMNVTVTGGHTIKKVAYTEYSSNKNLIVLDNDFVASQAGIATTSNKIAKIGNSIVISCSDDYDAVAASYVFLNEIIGYKALGPDYILYGAVPTLLPEISKEFTVTCRTRLTTNTMNDYSFIKMAINIPHTGNLFSSGPIDKPDQSIHNMMDWLPYDKYGSSHPKWYRSDGNMDVCWTARGDSGEYSAMVSELANRVYETFLANPTLEKVCLGMEDNNYCHCNCTSCKNGESSYTSYAGVGIKLVNDVISQLKNKPGMLNRVFFVYLLAYHNMTKCPTGISLDDHAGIIFASMRYDSGTSSSSPSKSNHALSIHRSENSFSKTQINNWANLMNQKSKYKDQIGFWYYDTMFNNYFGFTDTFESTLTWIEHSYHATNGNFQFMIVQGQGSKTPTGFETFKQYTIANAMVDIANKVNAYSNYATASDYENAVTQYLLELEDNFFGITSRTKRVRFNPTGEATYSIITDYNTGNVFSNDGYYGISSVNNSMYRMYLVLRNSYYYSLNKASNKLSPYMADELNLRTSTYASFSSGSNIKLTNYFNGSGTIKKYYRFDQISPDFIVSSLAHVSEAITAINASSDENKAVYLRHVEIESLCPYFYACMANSTNASYGYGNGITFGGKTYTLSEIRNTFKSICTSLNATKFSESQPLSKIYTIWGS